MVYLGPFSEYLISYEPGPGIATLWSTFLLLSNVPSSLNLGLIEYLGPSPVKGVKSVAPELAFVAFGLFLFSTGLLFVFDIVQEGYVVVTPFGSGLYLFGPGVNQGSSFSSGSNLLFLIFYELYFIFYFFYLC